MDEDEDGTAESDEEEQAHPATDILPDYAVRDLGPAAGKKSLAAIRLQFLANVVHNRAAGNFSGAIPNSILKALTDFALTGAIRQVCTMTHATAHELVAVGSSSTTIL